MAPPNPTSHHRPAAVRVFRAIYRALASLGLAVVLITASAAVLAWATFIEREYGTKAVHFGVYGTWWFASLVFLLGLNVLCAAIIRFPWKKHQTGFVITHAGILVLLAGCCLSWMGGIDAQMPIFEETAAYRAFVDTQHFELAIYRPLSESPAAESSQQRGFNERTASTANAEVVPVPFASGPFNWEDYQRLSAFPWAFSSIDRGTLYDRDGIRLEVLDYLSDSKSIPAPPLKLKVRTRPGKTPAAGAEAGPSTQPGGSSPDAWQSIELAIQDASSAQAAQRRVSLGGREALPGGQQIVFWIAGTQAETDAFLNSQPEVAPGSKAQVVLYSGGRRYVFPLDRLASGGRLPLGASGLQVELLNVDEQLWGASLRIIAPGEKSQRVMLLADYPEFNQHDKEHGVFGTFWHEAGPGPNAAAGRSETGSLRGIGRPRIDLLQGADGQLHYRVWKSPRLEAIGTLALDGVAHKSFADGDDEVSWYVEQFTPQDRPGERIQPAAFSAKKENSRKLRRALVQLTVDGISERFWLDGVEPSQFETPPRDGQRKVVCAGARRAAVTLAYDEIRVGCRVRLLSFNRKLDPGTSMASHYSSMVELLADDEKTAGKSPDAMTIGSDEGVKLLPKPVLVTLNEPVNFSDPRTGRSYRLFQESFAGPWKPGEDQFDQLVPSGSKKDQLFVSFLTINYDPGRGLKYTGSLLIVGGVVVMFYMRAYFFRRRARVG